MASVTITRARELVGRGWRAETWWDSRHWTLRLEYVPLVDGPTGPVQSEQRIVCRRDGAVVPWWRAPAGLDWNVTLIPGA